MVAARGRNDGAAVAAWRPQQGTAAMLAVAVGATDEALDGAADAGEGSVAPLGKRGLRDAAYTSACRR
jgi:hypothetical protein